MTERMTLHALSLVPRVALLAWLAQRGPASVRDIRREFAGVTEPQILQSLQFLAKCGWVRLSEDRPLTAVFDAGAIERLEALLDRYEPGALPAAQADAEELAVEVRALRPETHRAVLGAARRMRSPTPKRIAAVIGSDLGPVWVAWKHLEHAGLIEDGHLAARRPSQLRCLAAELGGAA